MRVGVTAVQGDYEKHTEALRDASAGPLDVVEVRTADDLRGVERLIVPGGESTTVGLLMQRFGLGDALKVAAAEGMPIWGTCMGMIIMAKRINDRPGQFTLDLLDIDVERNAFGAQVHSFEDAVHIGPLGENILGVFIRAPIVTRMGPDVQPIARYREKVVAVRQGNVVGTSFHPELTGDSRMHRWFLELPSHYRPR